jgi:hypothetical protein
MPLSVPSSAAPGVCGLVANIATVDPKSEWPQGLERISLISSIVAPPPAPASAIPSQEGVLLRRPSLMPGGVIGDARRD